ncbi:hypothetical protein AAH979_06435 [Plantactinospora sp. ZYX-F-223]|uniref:hypothetical protein n=1 Tax=Plantactinospora sp. ZYX-F-223 TaxID=3144103 RepID=UPI0031FE2458
MIGPNASSRPSVFAPFRPYLRQRLTDGVYETADLHAEILARGYQGSLCVLRDWLATNRTRPTPVVVRVPSARRITAWIMRPGHKLTDDDRSNLADARSRCPDLDNLAGLARGFAALVRHQDTGRHLDAWIDRARHAGYAELRGFAAGLASDRDAVVAGLTQPWSSCKELRYLISPGFQGCMSIPVGPVGGVELGSEGQPRATDCHRWSGHGCPG